MSLDYIRANILAHDMLHPANQKELRVCDVCNSVSIKIAARKRRPRDLPILIDFLSALSVSNALIDALAPGETFVNPVPMGDSLLA